MPGSDSTKICWQGILGIISNGIIRIGNPLLLNNVVNEQWQLHPDNQHWTGGTGQTDKFPDWDIAKMGTSAKTFVGDCRLNWNKSSLKQIDLQQIQA